MKIAKTAAAIITILVAITALQHSTGWAQGNNAPDIGERHHLRVRATAVDQPNHDTVTNQDRGPVPSP